MMAKSEHQQKLIDQQKRAIMRFQAEKRKFEEFKAREKAIKIQEAKEDQKIQEVLITEIKMKQTAEKVKQS